MGLREEEDCGVVRGREGEPQVAATSSLLGVSGY